MRRVLFWLHLVAGLVAGLAIALLCFTGMVLAFEKEIVAFAGRATATVGVPAGARPLALDELAARARAAHPDARLTAITVRPAPDAPIVFAFGREISVIADPYSGAVRPPAAGRTRAFMRWMTDLHRTLGFRSEASRPVGKAVTGAVNLAFLVLSLTGLYLWWPRSWSWRGFQAVAVLNLRVAGKARDWNWHHAVGLWSAPVLIVLTLTALPISYRWATNLLYTATGSPPPAPGAGPGALPPGPPVPPPAPDARPLGLDALLAAARTAAPGWTEITLRPAGGRDAAPRREAGTAELRRQNPATSDPAPAPVAEVPPARVAQALAVAVRTAGQWPRFATTTLHLDPFTGAVLRTEAFGDQPAGRRLRSWARFLHTGEALGWAGQLVAAAACAGGLVLCYTGFALAGRRFLGRARG